MSDLIERLRGACSLPTGLYGEAADEIERLQRENEELRKQCDTLEFRAGDALDRAVRAEQENEEVMRQKAYQYQRAKKAEEELATLRQQLAEAQAKLAAVERENEELRKNYTETEMLYFSAMNELAALQAQSTPASVWLWRNKTTFCFFATKELAMQMNSGGASTWVEPVEIPVIVNTALKASTEQWNETMRQKKAWADGKDAEPVGKRLTNAEMGIGWDRRAGEIIWWDMPPQGSYLFTTPPTATALLESLGNWVYTKMQQADSDYHNYGDTAEVYAILKMVLSKIESMMIESLPLIEGEK